MVKISSIASYLSLAAVLVAVATSQKVHAEDLARGVVVDRVACMADAEQTYALYLPSGYTPEKIWPIIYAFEPGARGKLPVGLFRDVAEQNGYIVVGSNNSRNGPGVPLAKIFAALWDDTHARFKIDERRVYAAGFSGGARVACFFAYVYEKRVAGVMAGGAGLPNNVHPPRTTPFALYCIAGVDDFNYFEVKDLDQLFDDLGLPHRLKIYEGGHEWPPSIIWSEAVRWMEFQAGKGAAGTQGDKFADDMFQRDLETARDAEAKGLVLDAYLAYAALARDFRGLRDVSEFERKAAALKDSKAMKEAVREEQEQRRRERASQTALVRLLPGFEDPDARAEVMAEFNPMVSDLLKKAAATKDSSERRVARRTLHGVFVGLFQDASNAYQIKDYSVALRRLEIAALLRPKDPFVFVFLARVYTLKGNKKSALATLKRAVENGLNNPLQLQQQKDLDPLRDEPDFKKLVDTLSNKAP